MEIDDKKIGALTQGITPICEPGLEHLASQNSAAGCLQFPTEFASGAGSGPVT